MVRALTDDDWHDVRRIYAEGIATGDATFETEPAPAERLAAHWLPGHRWIIELDGRGVGKALLTHQVRAADEDPHVWTLQTSIFPENSTSIRLHEWAGFWVVGTRERIGRLNGRWRDTVLLERRSVTPA